MKTDRFPNDFMFQLAPEEHKFLRFRFGILKKGRHSKYFPYAFTEHSVVMQHIHALEDAKLAGNEKDMTMLLK
ncbi:MAG: ORF6N domain-containing protein [Thermodesulfobacteriota bacterium]|nr:ORF6N domain-containing protein [Thermodesulfobacteriota bacterium]